MNVIRCLSAGCIECLITSISSLCKFIFKKDEQRQISNPRIIEIKRINLLHDETGKTTSSSS